MRQRNWANYMWNKDEAVNIMPLNVSEEDSTISIELAIETAEYYGISHRDAEKIAKEITEIVKNHWERLAAHYGISRGSMEKMRPAFSACYDDF